MPRFILLCGPTASGKTNFCRNFVKKNPDAVYLSKFEIIKDWADAEQLPYEEAYLKYKDDAPPLMEDIAREAFAAQRDVVWNGKNLTRQQREDCSTYVPDDYERISVAFEAPRAFLQTSLEQASPSTYASIGKESLERQIEAYERPDFDEGFDQIVLITQPGHVVRVL